jgi:hypothetical protein
MRFRDGSDKEKVSGHQIVCSSQEEDDVLWLVTTDGFTVMSLRQGDIPHTRKVATRQDRKGQTGQELGHHFL